MDDKENNETRKSTPAIKVYCLPEERAEIVKLAATTGHSTSTYLRLVGLGHRVEGVVDVEQVRELVRVNGDLGRLGGLLKLWLSNDVKVASLTPASIVVLLSKIEATRDAMSGIMEKVVRPRMKQ